MSYGLSLILIAVGAILTWGVSATVTGIDVHAIGAILMVVGVIGLAMTLLFWSSISPLGEGGMLRRRDSQSNTVVDNTPNVIVDRRPAVTVLHDSTEPTVVVHDRERR